MIYLGNYRKQTRALTIVSHLVVAVATSMIWFALVTIFYMDHLLALVYGTLGGIVVGITFGVVIEATLMRPIELLTQAILHVSPEVADQPAPDIKHVVYGRQMLNQAIGMIYDIAAGSQSQQEKMNQEHEYMNALLSASPMPIVVLDHEQTIRYFNLAASTFIGDKIEKVIGQPFDTIFNLGFTQDVTLRSWLEKCQQSGIKETNTWDRVRLTKTDQTTYMFDVVASYSKNDSHGIETLVMLFDHTNLYLSDENEVSFVSLAAHELRAPITVLRGYIELFEEELGASLNDEQKQFMYKMEVSANQLSTFINNILTVARVDSDQMAVRLAKEDWITILESSKEEFTQRAAVRGRKLEYQLPESLPEVAADRISIYEVVSNLLDNAIKYSPEGGKVIVSAHEKDGEIETTVQDFGIGIPTSLVDKLFEKFYRSHRSRDNVGGTGLGLYLCKAIVEAHGGQIWVRSVEGQGTTFGFTLPLYAKVADQVKSDNNNGGIVRGAHGWIKNHSMYRR